MEPYIQISQLNDFIFCPKSIFFHKLYGKYSQSLYHEKPQTAGKLAHENIDKGQYSSLRRYKQCLELYSEKYNFCGKLDIYDMETHSIIERKNLIKKIYDGYVYQLHAQYFCLVEMGYEVEKLFLHSLQNNKRYPVDLPDKESTKRFEELVQSINRFDPGQKGFFQNPEKCRRCIYNELCDSCSIHNENPC